MSNRMCVCSACGTTAKHFGLGLCAPCYFKQPRPQAYRRWRDMVRRCTDPRNKSWKDYGGRGITVCARWMDFEAYYADTGDAPAGMTLDRINNDGNYEPDNWRWATRTVQNQNRRSSAYSGNVSKTHCPQGHPYDEANTWRRTRVTGARQCRACDRIRHKARRDAKRAAA